MSFEAPSAVSPTLPCTVAALPFVPPATRPSDRAFQSAAGTSLLTEPLSGPGLPPFPGEAMVNVPPSRLSIESMGSYGSGEPMPMPISPLGTPGGNGDPMLFSPLVADVGMSTPGQPRGGLAAAVGDIGPSPRVSYSSTGSGPAAAAASAMAISPRVSLTGMLPMSVAPHSGRPMLYRVPRGLLSPLISPSVSVTPSPPVPATVMGSPSPMMGGGSGGVGSGRDGFGSGGHGTSLPPRPRRSRSPSVGRVLDGSAVDFMRVGSDVMSFMPSNSPTEAVAADTSFLCDTVAVTLPDPVETSLTPELLASIGPSGVPISVPSPPALVVPNVPPSSLSPTRPQPPSPLPLPPLPLPPLRASTRPTSQPPPPDSTAPAVPPLPLPPLRVLMRPAQQPPLPLASSPLPTTSPQPPLSPTPPSPAPSRSRQPPPPPSPSPSSHSSRCIRQSRLPSSGSVAARRQQRFSAPPRLPASHPADTRSVAAPTSTATATVSDSGIELRYAAAAEVALAQQRHGDAGSADAEAEAAAALSAMGGNSAGSAHGAIGSDLVEMTDRFSRQHVGGEAHQHEAVAETAAPRAGTPSRQRGGVFPATVAVPKSSGSDSQTSAGTPSADGPSSGRTGSGAMSSGLGDTASVSAHAEQFSSQQRFGEGASVADLAGHAASLESAAAPARGATTADVPGTTAAPTSDAAVDSGSGAARGSAPPSASESEWEEQAPPSGLCTRCGHEVPPCALCNSMRMDMKRLYRAVADAQAEASTLRAELKVAEMRVRRLNHTRRAESHALVAEGGRPPESSHLNDSWPLGSSTTPLVSHAEATGGHERRRVPPAHAASQRGMASAAPPSPLPPSIATTDGVPDRLEDVWSWLGAPHPPPVEVPLPDTPKAQMLLAKNAKAHPCARSPCNSVDGHFSHILATAHHYINKRAQEAQEAMGVCRGRFSDLKEALEVPGGPKVEWPFGMFNKLTNAIVKERKEVAKYRAKAAETDLEIENLESGKVVMSDAAARSLRALASRYKLTAARGQAKVDDCTAYLFQLGCNVTYTCFIGVGATAANRAASSSAQQAFGSGSTVSAATATVNDATDEGGAGNAVGISSSAVPSSRPALRPTSRPTSLPVSRTTLRPTSLPTSRTKAYPASRPTSRPSSRPTSGTYSIASLLTPTTTAADVTMGNTVGDSLEDVSLGLGDRATSYLDTPGQSVQESDVDAHTADDEKEDSTLGGGTESPVEAAAGSAPLDDALRPARAPTAPLPSRIPVARGSTSGIPLRRADRTWRGVGDPAVTAAVAAAAAASFAAGEQRRPSGHSNDRRGWSTSTPRRTIVATAAAAAAATAAAAAPSPARRAFTSAQPLGAAAVTASPAAAAVTTAAATVTGATEAVVTGAARSAVRGAAEEDEAPSVKRRRSRPSDPRLVKRVPQEGDTNPTEPWVVDNTVRPPRADAGGHDPDLLPCRWD